MQMGFGLYQEQTQKLLMTTQMKQAIEILQCSSAELDQLVASELSDNPFAEYDPTWLDGQQSWTARVASRRAAGAGVRREAFPLEQIVKSEPSLIDHLENQLRMTRAPSRLVVLASHIAGCVDESGYLRETDEELAQMLGVPEFVVGEAIDVLQSCDPPGIAARSLKECLLLQLDRVREDVRSTVRDVIENHLEDVGAARIQRIAKQLGVTAAAVQDAIDAIRRLDPRPGLAYGGGKAQYVIPDVIVERVGQSYVVITNEMTQPTVRISSGYRTMLRHPESEEARQFLWRKLNAAEWLVRSLEQRRLTLYRVADAIVQVQRGFFDVGPRGMKPLTLRQIADELGLHESTISRATRGKYMQTPRGVYEMKYFFTAEIHGDDGATSAQAAKHQIRLCIDGEDKRAPFSDDALVHELEKHGIHISRRTVAKYREEMRIPSSGKRRRFEEND